MSKPSSVLSRYDRQMLLPGIGQGGQQRIADASVLIVGVGALGCAIAELLCRAGVGCGDGRVVLVDRDAVELTNLQRQCLFAEADVGEPKAVAAKRRLEAINAQCHIEARVEDLNHRNAAALANGVDALLDGTDNFYTRFLLDDLAACRGLPYLYGGAVGTIGAAMAILPATDAGDAPWERAGITTPTLRDIFGGYGEVDNPEGGKGAGGPTCDTAGVLGPLIQIVAAFQATESIKAITGNWQAIDGRMLQVDPWANTMRRVSPPIACVSGEPTPPGERVYHYLEGRHEPQATRLCGRNAVQLHATNGAAPLDLSALKERLTGSGDTRLTPFMMRFRPTSATARDIEGNTANDEPVELSVFADGRVIVRGTEDAGLAETLVRRFIGR